MNYNILISGGGTGLTHTLSSTKYGLMLADALIAQNHNVNIYHNWRHWEHFNNIFDVQHVCYSKAVYTEDHSFFVPVKKIASNLNISVTDLLINPPSIEITNIKVDAASTYSLTKDSTFFETFKLHNDVFKKFKEYYYYLNNGNYVAIQFRGSDMLKVKNISPSDFICTSSKKIEDILKTIKSEQKVLLTSDNQEILTKYVDNKKIFSQSLAYLLYKRNIVVDVWQRLHSTPWPQTTDVTEYEMCENSVIDFFLLTHSKILYADTKSGFGQTANFLWKCLQENDSLRCL